MDRKSCQYQRRLDARYRDSSRRFQRDIKYRAIDMSSIETTITDIKPVLCYCNLDSMCRCNFACRTESDIVVNTDDTLLFYDSDDYHSNDYIKNNFYAYLKLLVENINAKQTKIYHLNSVGNTDA